MLKFDKLLLPWHSQLTKMIIDLNTRHQHRVKYKDSGVFSVSLQPLCFDSASIEALSIVFFACTLHACLGMTRPVPSAFVMALMKLKAHFFLCTPPVAPGTGQSNTGKSDAVGVGTDADTGNSDADAGMGMGASVGAGMLDVGIGMGAKGSGVDVGCIGAGDLEVDGGNAAASVDSLISPGVCCSGRGEYWPLMKALTDPSLYTSIQAPIQHC